eukprot:6542264-Pyramimonas_sp.AAC.1
MKTSLKHWCRKFCCCCKWPVSRLFSSRACFSRARSGVTSGMGRGAAEGSAAPCISLLSSSKWVREKPVSVVPSGSPR